VLLYDRWLSAGLIARVEKKGSSSMQCTVVIDTQEAVLHD
jgi:hypothetical protein